jgi:hypothetical protein
LFDVDGGETFERAVRVLVTGRDCHRRALRIARALDVRLDLRLSHGEGPSFLVGGDEPSRIGQLATQITFDVALHDGLLLALVQEEIDFRFVREAHRLDRSGCACGGAVKDRGQHHQCREDEQREAAGECSGGNQRRAKTRKSFTHVFLLCGCEVRERIGDAARVALRTRKVARK